MRPEFIIAIAVIAGLAVFSASRAGRRKAETMTDEIAQAKKRLVEIRRRTVARLAELRRERRRIVDDFARKADAVRAAKVKKDLESI